MGPPEKEAGPLAKGPANAEVTNTNTSSAHSSDIGAPEPAWDTLAGNARRYGASRRMAPLPPCGCVSDPAHDRHRCGEQLSDHMAQAAVSAATHLDQLGTPALLDHRTCRAMWRIGHHKLAAAVYRRTAGAG